MLKMELSATEEELKKVRQEYNETGEPDVLKESFGEVAKEIHYMNKSTKEEILSYAEEICEKYLKIPSPEIEINNAAEKYGGVICEKGKLKILLGTEFDKMTDLDQCYLIAHELRHCWQVIYYAEYFKDFKERKECIDEIEYNLQKSEIDAAAFARIMTEVYFGISPVYPVELSGIVEERYQKLFETEFEKIQDRKNNEMERKTTRRA